MRLPSSPFTLGVTVYDTDGSTGKANVTVTIRDENTNETLSDDTDSNGQVVFNLANLTSGWTVGDIISYYVLYSGYEASGPFSATDTGGTTVTLTLASVPSAPSLRYFTVQEFLDSFNLATYSADNENGLKPEIVVKVGESVEEHIDRITNRKWDNNSGSYYTATQEYHNAEGAPSTWPESVGSANVSSQKLYFTKFTPIQSLTTFEVNKNSPNSTANWTALTAANNEIKVRNSIGRIEITDSSDYPAAGKDQVRITYTYGESSVPKDIKRLAILMTAMAFAGQELQRLNIEVSEASGLNSAIQNYTNVLKNEIGMILDNRRFADVRGI